MTARAKNCAFSSAYSRGREVSFHMEIGARCCLHLYSVTTEVFACDAHIISYAKNGINVKSEARTCT
jgi:hypothetical protein